MQIEFINIERDGSYFAPKIGLTKGFEAFAVLVPELKLGQGVDYSKGDLLTSMVFSSILDVVNFAKKKFPDSALVFTIDGSRIEFFKYLYGSDEGRKVYEILMGGEV